MRVLTITFSTFFLLNSCSEPLELPTAELSSSVHTVADVCKDIEKAASRLREVSSLFHKFCTENLKSNLDLPRNIYSATNPQAKILSNLSQKKEEKQYLLNSFHSMEVKSSASRVFGMYYLEATNALDFANKGFREVADKSSVVYELKSKIESSANERNISYYYKKTKDSLVTEYEATGRFLKVDENNFIVFSVRDTSKPSKNLLFLQDVKLITKLGPDQSRVYSLSLHVLDATNSQSIIDTFKSDIEADRFRQFENSQKSAQNL